MALHAQCQGLQSTHREVGVEGLGTAPAPFCRKPNAASRSSSSVTSAHPPHRSARRCTWSSSAARCRRRAEAAAAAPARQTCCPPEPLRPRHGRSRRSPRCRRWTAAVGRRLHPDHPGVTGDGRPDRVQVGEMDRGMANAPVLEHFVDQAKGAAVASSGMTMGYRAQHRPQGAVTGGHPGTERPFVVAVFDGGQHLLQRGPRGYRCARIRTRHAVRRRRPARRCCWRRSGVDRPVAGSGR